MLWMVKKSKIIHAFSDQIQASFDVTVQSMVVMESGNFHQKIAERADQKMSFVPAG